MNAFCSVFKKQVSRYFIKQRFAQTLIPVCIQTKYILLSSSYIKAANIYLLYTHTTKL